MPINQPIPLSQEKKKRGCYCYRSYTDCSAYLPYRTYMYNHQQAVSSRPMKKNKDKGEKEENKRGRGMEKKWKQKRKERKKRERKEKKRQSRVQEDEQTCSCFFSLARVAQIPGTVSFDLHHEQLHSWEIWFDWFQPEPTGLGAAGTLPTGRYISSHS